MIAICPSEKLAQDVLEEFHAMVEHIRFSWLDSMVYQNSRTPVQVTLIFCSMLFRVGGWRACQVTCIFVCLLVCFFIFVSSVFG